MATQAQIQANRSNAQKSTGPRTTDGKAAVSQNALKHGLCAERTVIAGEDLGEFEFYRDRMLGELTPDGEVESMLAERVVSLSWRLRRTERAQNEAFDALLAKDADFPLPRLKKSLPTKNDSDVFVEETPLGRAVVRDFTYARVLDRLSMYERRIEYSLYKSMNELRRLRLVREIEPATENPPRPDERWGRPDPTSATEPTGGEAERLRQTNPIAGDANGPDQGQRLPCDAKQSQLASGAGAAPEADRAKQTQSAAARTNLPWQKGVCGQAPQMQNKPNLPGRRFAEHG